MFRLSEKKPEQQGTLLYYSSDYLVDEVENTLIQLIDDTSVNKPTLGQRRLVLCQTEKLYNIRSAIYFLVDLIKLAKSSTWFIDSLGRTFQYKKTTRAKLQSFKIKKVLPAPGLGCVIEVESILSRFKSMTRPHISMQYAAVLTFNKTHLLYGFFEEPFKSTWRMV